MIYPAPIHDVPALIDQPAAFLKAVWSVLPKSSLVALSARTERRDPRNGKMLSYVEMLWSKSTTNISSILGKARIKNSATGTLSDTGSIYWQGASRKEKVLNRIGARGDKSELENVGSFWCDLDIEKHDYTYAQGIDTLLKMPLPPSIIVFSGGGLQAVHLLSAPIAIPDRAAAEEYRAMSVGLYAPTFRVAGIDLDTSVHDATRMMRLPGFINRKSERKGAVALLLYFNPECRYSPEEIEYYSRPYRAAETEKRLARKKTVTENETNSDGVFMVGRKFIEFTVNGRVPEERHPTLLKLAWDAKHSGMNVEQALSFLRPLALKWFANDTHRSGYELDSLTQWVFGQNNDDQILSDGHYAVVLEDGVIKLAPEDKRERRKMPVPIAGNSSRKGNTEVSEIAQGFMNLEMLRREQDKIIDNYLNSNSEKGSLLLLRTSPGAGKTYAMWQAIAEKARIRKLMGKKTPFALILSPFKNDEGNLSDFYAAQGVNPEDVFYFAGRTGDEKSKGYCAKNDHANALGQKGYAIKSLLCTYCPLKQKCEQNGYLRQFEEMEKYPIIHARHQHGTIEEISASKEIIFFDENPLGIVSGPLIVTAEELKIDPPRYLENDHAAAIETVNFVLSAIKSLLIKIPPAPKNAFPDTRHFRRGGKWFFSQLVALAGQEKVKAFIALDKKLIKDMASPALQWRDNDTESELSAFQSLSPYFLPTLHQLIKEEYSLFCSVPEETPGWNSRIICFHNLIRLYSMNPFVYSAKTKIIVADATGNPALYEKAFFYKSQGALYPSGHIVFDPQLQPLAKITQFIGSDNTRSALKERLPKNETDIAFSEEGFDSPLALKKAKTIILDLIERHKGSLLIVTYKKTADQLKKWLPLVAPAFDLNNVQWFGGLRGKNDFKDLEAVFLFGTPRIPAHDVLIEAMIWNYKDALLVDERGAKRLIPYAQMDLAYPILSYADDRIHDIYIQRIASEMRQCYERIRPNASTQSKFVYLGSGFPCSDHVDEFQQWSGYGIFDILKQAIPKNGILWHREAVELLMKETGISRSYAYEKFNAFVEECRKTGEFEVLEDGRFAGLMLSLAVLEDSVLAPDPTKKEKIKAMIRKLGGWGDKTVRSMQDLLACTGLKVSVGTLQKIKIELADESRRAALGTKNSK